MNLPDLCDQGLAPPYQVYLIMDRFTQPSVDYLASLLISCGGHALSLTKSNTVLKLVGLSL